MQTSVVLAIALLSTLGALAFGVARVKVGTSASVVTAISLAVGLSLTVLAASVALTKAVPILGGPNAGIAPFVAAALFYVAVVGWFLYRRQFSSPASLVIAATVSLAPLWYLAVLVALSVSCFFGDCI